MKKTEFGSTELLVEYIIGKTGCQTSTVAGKKELSINNHKIIIDIEDDKVEIEGLSYDRRTSCDLTKPENHSTLILLIQLLQKGYSPSNIIVEKSWQTGRSASYLDIMITNPHNQEIIMIDVKSNETYEDYTNVENERKIKQLFSYVMQEAKTTVAAFYTYNFESNENLFSTVYCKELRQIAVNVDDFFERWNKIYDNEDLLKKEQFNFKKSCLKYNLLREIRERDTKILFNQFATILRLNSISDKPTAFIRIINLFLSKLADEIAEDQQFLITNIEGENISCDGMRFQYIEGESAESFMKRLNDLYKEGMKRYLNRDVIDYSDTEIERILESNPHKKDLLDMFDNLRLKKDVNFSFIEVYDNKTFLENFEVVKDVVSLLEKYKFKYETKHQFLGDFFEELLNTSLKQSEGQFFTPYPLVDFMVKSLNIEDNINNNLNAKLPDIIPTAIDYACGAGHFLISYMTAVQNVLSNIDTSNLTSIQKRNIDSYKQNPYSWVKDRIVGIEKDYRLAKTTKIATFLNGDGDADIISGDGINKFSCEEYHNTLLYNTSLNHIDKFNYVISNPPYSVEGFMKNLRKNGINENSDTFDLIDSYSQTDARIEMYFVERAWQLLQSNGIAAIILPQSVLSGNKYEKLRKYIFSHFKILCLFLSADITFSGTTTSPVVLFLRKERMSNINYNVLVHKSPKYSNPTANQKKKETTFLGYSFSNNRNSPGIKILPQSIINRLIPITKDFISTGNCDIEYSEYSSIRNLNDFVINKKENYIGDIFPKYYKQEGKSIGEYCYINKRTEDDFDTTPTKYLEISNMKTQIPTKKKTTTRYCKKGDILISSLCPSSDKIVIATGEFMLTTAIHVLSNFSDEGQRDKIFNTLKSQNLIKQMNALTEGFKTTYSKISEYNLENNIFINI